MSCDRFERERLAAVDEPPDEHEQGCADCTEARRRYRAVGELVAGAGADRELPAAWYGATLGMLQARPRQRRRQRMLIGASGLVAAAAAAMLVLWPRPPVGPVGPDEAPHLTLRIDRSGAPLRGSTPHPGDLLVVHARAAGRRHLELRVYRADREAVLRCADDLPCHPSAGAVDATVALTEAGRYRVLLMSSDREMPPAGATLDQAAAQVSEQGGATVVSEPVDVL